MFPGVGVDAGRGKDIKFAAMTKDLVDIEMAAHGGTVIEIRKPAANGRWCRDSKYNRRITASDTEMEITGPAAGHDRMKTKADPDRHQGASACSTTAPAASRPGAPGCRRRRTSTATSGARSPTAIRKPRTTSATASPATGTTGAPIYDRFDVAKEPNEANRFGWMVEIDPIDPASTPMKRTALGRFKHEGADEHRQQGRPRRRLHGRRRALRLRLQVRHRRQVQSDDRAANMDLLDKGTLYVARYNADGTGEWLPLVHGQGPLTAENGFTSQADVADPGAPRRRSAGRHQDGPAGGRRGQPEDRQGLRDADQQHASARPSRSTPPTRAPTTPSATSSR